MCLIVEIRANEKIIETLVATNITPKFKGLKYGKGIQKYKFGKQIIRHRFEDGALVLASKIIKLKNLMQEKSNYMQVGRTIECGACHPEKYEDCEKLRKEYPGLKPCDCICHDKVEETIQKFRDKFGTEFFGSVAQKEIEQFILEAVEEARIKETLRCWENEKDDNKRYDQRYKKELKLNINELHKYSFSGKWFLKYQEIIKLLK